MELKWSYTPYMPYRMRWQRNIYIHTLRPKKCGFYAEWKDDKEDCKKYNVIYGKKDSESREKISVSGNSVTVTGLEDITDYEFYIESEDGVKSGTRLVKTGEPIGNVITYLHPDDEYVAYQGRYLGSPSLIRLKSGKLLASFDYFKTSAPMCMTSVFASCDDGETWEWQCDVMPAEWSAMFTHNDRLYMFAISREYGDILIGESKDEGKTWESPAVLERGPGNGMSGFHRGPTRPTVYEGRIWIAVENGSWSDGGFADCVISAPENSDLTDASNWTLSEPKELDLSWRNGGKAPLIEGNTFAGDGSLNILYRCAKNTGIILKADVMHPEKQLEFSQVVKMPCGHTKFEIQNGGDGYWYAAGNDLYGNTEKEPRNVLSFYRSKDCISWEKIKDIVDRSDLDMAYNGFQYPSFIIENGNVTLMSRTAFNGAHTFHDSNMMTIHKFKV